MTLPIYEQVRRTVPCSLLFDDTLTPADEADALADSVELDHLPIIATRPDEMASVWWSILAMVGLVGMLAFIMYAAVVSA
ncbi:hypothetical protein [Rhodococcus sp. YH1]|uniref:hypothetical protein n=1 Tax=Rhodococcus sp. YH1 TaxID=89066 RepID=UPI0013871404|nr:hypothetical protein [Rhodococcus sp. YH1]